MTSSADWVDLLLPESSYTELQTKAVDDLVRGESYSFQIRARNIYGFGPFSTTSDILAATFPSPPLIATTETLLTNVRITFLAAEDNGVPIISYDVEILKADGDYLASPDCDASLVEIANSYYQCDISFTKLRVSPFWLQFDTLVEVRVRATNSIGTGFYS
jgi:hypothetical protein